MKKIEVRCELVENNNSKELFIYGPVLDNKSYWYDEGEYICPQNIIDLLKDVNVEDDLTIRINSYGGSVFAGIAIYNLLKSHKGNVNTMVDGIAASAASIIAMAGDKILMAKNSMMMIHNAWCFTSGNAKELRKVADDLDKIGDSLVETYMDKFVGTVDELKTLLDDESYLTANECIDLGLATEIVDNSSKDDDAQAKQNKVSILAKYRERAKLNEADKNEGEKTEECQSFIFNKFGGNK
ncbi:MAG: Clp protease ClpP [Peptostreptococcus porci]|nr:Clp protease ClpP [Peptostreptococcus porci]